MEAVGIFFSLRLLFRFFAFLFLLNIRREERELAECTFQPQLPHSASIFDEEQSISKAIDVKDGTTSHFVS